MGRIQLTQPSKKDLNNRYGFKKGQSDKRNVYGLDYILESSVGQPVAREPHAALCFISCGSYIHIEVCVSYKFLHHSSSIQAFFISNCFISKAVLGKAKS